MSEREPSPVDRPVVAPPASAWRAAGVLFRPLLAVALVLLLVLATALGIGRWLMDTEDGSRWLLARLPGVQAEGFEGRLLGPDWKARRLSVKWKGGQAGLVLEDLEARGVRWELHPHLGAWFGIQAEHLKARSAVLNTGPSAAVPGPLPASIVVPLRVDVAEVRLDQLVIDRLAPWSALALDGFTMDPRASGGYRSRHAVLEAFGLHLEGPAAIGAKAPLRVEARITARPLAGGERPRWAAALRAEGPLETLQVQASLRAVPQVAVQTPGREASGAAATPPLLEADLELWPRRPWKVGRLHLETQDLDLSTLVPGAPQTQLSGSARFNGGGRDRALGFQLALVNGRPGPWDARRLPVASAQLEARSANAQFQRIDVTRFDLQFADAAGPAGRWSGQGQWQGHELKLDSLLEALTPQRLDHRAAAMIVGGTLKTRLRGLPQPTLLAGQGAGTPPPWALGWTVAVQGRLDPRPQLVQLEAEGEVDARQLQVRRLQAQSGEARAEGSVQLAREGEGWRVQTQGAVAQFDPLPWWPGDVGSTWRRGPHRFSGDWQLALRLPARTPDLPAWALLQRISGDGRLQLRDSLLAGVPLQARADLAQGAAAAAAGAAPATVKADVQLAANRLQLDGRAYTRGDGGSDRWRLDVQAEQLSQLAPLARLHPELAEFVPRAGSVQASVTADGRWPLLRTEGTLQVRQLLAGALGVDQLQGQWRLDIRDPSAGQQPLTLKVDAQGVLWERQRAQRLQAELRGTAADHRLELSGQLPWQPPADLRRVLQLRPGAAGQATQLNLLAQGAWRPASAGGGRWQAVLDRLTVAPVGAGPSANTVSNAGPAPWLDVAGLKSEWLFERGGQLRALSADPGSARIGEPFRLRWQRLQLERGSDDALRGQLQADVEPFAVAPLVSRWRPKENWQGDLQLSARLDVRAAETVEADITFERSGGDLQLVNDTGRQALGLTAARFTLQARQGRWIANTQMQGQTLGDLSGELQSQTTPQAWWPEAEAPLTGRLLLRVPDVGVWTGWAPPGWRLGGEAQLQADVGGQVGAPTLTGRASGQRLTVRNLLEGVNLTDGAFDLRLNGQEARLESLSLRAGDGQLNGSGTMVLFGPQRQISVALKAERFRLLGRVDRSLVTSGDLDLRLSPSGGQLKGALKVDEGVIDISRSDAPRLDSDVVVRRTDARIDVPDEPGRGLPLDLALDLGEKLRVRGYGLDALLRGDLRVQSPGAGAPRVQGTIRAEQGNFAAYGQKLVLERGEIRFSGAADNPRLDVLALRPNLDLRVGVQVTGALQNMRVKLYSQPDLSEAEKLSWLVTGQAPDSLGRNDAALLQQAALALLAGEGEAPTDTLLKTLGLDKFGVRQTEGTTTTARDTVVTVGRQINRRVYVGYERGVNATTGTLVLIYRIAQRFTLKLQGGADSSADVNWVSRFQEVPADAPVRKVTIPAPAPR